MNTRLPHGVKISAVLALAGSLLATAPAQAGKAPPPPGGKGPFRLPDLVLYSHQILYVDANVSPNIAPGYHLLLTVKNIGDAPAPASRTVVGLITPQEAVLLPPFPTPPLGVGAAFTLDVPSVSPAYTFEVTVDAGNRILEKFEVNNFQRF